MRSVFACQLCLTVFQAFLLAPVQHVHEESDHQGRSAEHSTVVHAHFSSHFVSPASPGQRSITESEEQEFWSLDTFTIVLPVALVAVVPSRSPYVPVTPRIVTAVAPAAEERSHDPPARDVAIPRAPPA